MSSNNLFRYAGFAAIGSAIAIAASFASAIPTGGQPGTLSTIFVYLGTVLFIPLIYALYVIYRPEKPAASMAFLVAGALLVVTSLIDPYGTTPVGIAGFVISGIAILLVGYLGYHSSRTPRSLALFSYFLGALTLVTTALFAVAPSAGEIAVVLLNLVYIVWMLWFARILLSGQTVAATA